MLILSNCRAFVNMSTQVWRLTAILVCQLETDNNSLVWKTANNFIGNNVRAYGRGFVVSSL